MPRSIFLPILVIAVIWSVTLAGKPAAVSAALEAHEQHQAPRLGLRANAVGQVSGIDISSIQHPSGAAIDWSTVAAAGYSFAYVKATEGTYYTNPYYSADFAGATGVGMEAGAYTFANPSGASGTADADYLLGYINYTDNGATLPPMLDLEGDPYQAGDTCWGLSTAAMISWISSFVNEVHVQTGQYTLIYTSAGWWSQCTGSSAAFSSEPLSVASYGTTSPTVPSGWPNWTIWQFSASGNVPGITGATDLDYFNGNTAALDAFAKGVAPAPDQAQYWVATNSNGALEVFLRGGDGQFWTDYQTQAGNNASWSGWHPMGGSWPGEPAVVMDRQGRLELFARGGDGQLWHAYETQAGNSASWSGFYRLGGSWPRDPVAIAQPDGAIDVYAVGGDGQLWHAYQTQAAGSASWSGFYPLGGYWPGQPVLSLESDGRVDVFARGGDGRLWHRYQTVAGNEFSWSGWYRLGGAAGLDPAVARNSDGRLEVLLSGNGTAVSDLYETQAGNSSRWSGVASLGGDWPDNPTLGMNSNGRLEVFEIGADGRLWHAYQTVAANSTSWSGWHPLGGSWPSPPALGVNASKGLQVFLVGGDAGLWNAYETVPGNSASWSGFYPLGGDWPTP